MSFSWVLFDADGVLQRLRDGWLASITDFGGEDFVLDLFRSEGLCMAGQNDFTEIARQLCAEHGVTADVTDVLEPSHRIVTDDAMLDAVRTLQRQGTKCALATNQQNERGGWMQGHLPYPELFDESFYSFELGFAKPDRGYFTAIIDRLGVETSELFFLDDKEKNVEAARSVGIAAEVFPLDGGVAALRPILAGHGLDLDG